MARKRKHLLIFARLVIHIFFVTILQADQKHSPCTAVDNGIKPWGGNWPDKSINNCHKKEGEQDEKY